MIRAVYRQGTILPLDAVPAGWREGEELLVQEVTPSVPSADVLAAWAADVQAAAECIGEADHVQFMAILADVEAESKEQGRQHLEQSP